jgi:hypothetical protein
MQFKGTKSSTSSLALLRGKMINNKLVGAA